MSHFFHKDKIPWMIRELRWWCQINCLILQIQEFGKTEIRDLKPNGRNLPVTEENKKEYIKLVCVEKMTGAIRKQLNAFLEGFYDIIPKHLISIFNEQELELLISGLPTIDIDDLKATTEYHKYQANSLQVKNISMQIFKSLWAVHCKSKMVHDEGCSVKTKSWHFTKSNDVSKYSQ